MRRWASRKKPSAGSIDSAVNAKIAAASCWPLLLPEQVIEFLDAGPLRGLGVGPLVEGDEGGHEVAVGRGPIGHPGHRLPDLRHHVLMDKLTDCRPGVAVVDGDNGAMEVQVLGDE